MSGSLCHSTVSDFMNRLKPGFGLKFKTLVSGFRLSGFHKGAKSMDLLSQ